jgi:hypothetical protein
MVASRDLRQAPVSVLRVFTAAADLQARVPGPEAQRPHRGRVHPGAPPHSPREVRSGGDAETSRAGPPRSPLQLV